MYIKTMIAVFEIVLNIVWKGKKMLLSTVFKSCPPVDHANNDFGVE